jgi:hypothetical protein
MGEYINEIEALNLYSAVTAILNISTKDACNKCKNSHISKADFLMLIELIIVKLLKD